jgi:4-hydroxy-tetrahydrodipicolinate reductase
MNPVRVVVYGVGAMGSLMVQLLERKAVARVVGAIDWDPLKAGRDLGDVAGLGYGTGITVSAEATPVLDNAAADVVLIATTAFAAEAQPQIEAAVARGSRVVTIAQELFFPLGDAVERAAAIDRAAKSAGAAVTAVGINPGFIMDVLPIVGSFPCWEVESVAVRRHVDFSPYGPDEMAHIGAGLTAEAFRTGAADGTIGHIGLLETAAMVASCVGIEVDELRQSKEPLLAVREHVTPHVRVAPGRVCGFRQTVSGWQGDRQVLDFRMVGVLDPRPADGIELGDHARLTGTPSVDIAVREEISQRGGLGTAAVAVNTIPLILAAAPGFHTIDTLTLPRRWHARTRGARPIRVCR